MIRALKITVMFVILAAVLLAGDVNGKWAGSVDTPDGAVPLTFNLTADGGAVTGTVVTGGPNGGPDGVKISDGKLDGDVVTFTFVTNYHGDPIKLICKGQLTADGLKMQMGTEDGGWSAEFLTKKAS